MIIERNKIIQLSMVEISYQLTVLASQTIDISNIIIDRPTTPKSGMHSFHFMLMACLTILFLYKYTITYWHVFNKQ